MDKSNISQDFKAMTATEKAFAINQIREKLEDLQTWQLHQLLIEVKQASEASLRPSKCRSCNALIIWGKTPTSKACPFDWKSGESHFKTCPDANKWGKTKHSPSASIMGQCKCSECKPRLPGLNY